MVYLSIGCSGIFVFASNSLSKELLHVEYKIVKKRYFLRGKYY